jgi:uncharacterized protein
MKLKTLALMFLATAAFALPSKPTGFVTDEAGIIDTATHQGLERSLNQFEKTTTIEIAVVTVPTLGGVSVEEYANKLFHAWGIGKRGSDNGVLLLVAKNDHKMRIEVGYGLESKLNDGQAGEIIRGMVPYFRQGNFSFGISNAVDQIKGKVK